MKWFFWKFTMICAILDNIFHFRFFFFFFKPMDTIFLIYFFRNHFLLNVSISKIPFEMVYFTGVKCGNISVANDLICGIHFDYSIPTQIHVKTNVIGWFPEFVWNPNLYDFNHLLAWQLISDVFELKSLEVDWNKNEKKIHSHWVI